MSCGPLVLPADLVKMCGCDLDSIDPGSEYGGDVGDLIEAVILSAGHILEDLAQLELGRCEHVLRPCHGACREAACGCCRLSGLVLRGIAPRVTQVTIDGVVVDPDTYAVITDQMGRPSLERFYIDGRPDHWPGCQSLGLPDTAEGTFAVTVETGLELNFIGRHAVAEVACELLSPYVTVKGEALPAGTKTFNGYGISGGIARDVAGSEADEIEQYMALPWTRRFLGLPSVAGRRTAARVWSPEIDDGFTTFLVPS